MARQKTTRLVNSFLLIGRQLEVNIGFCKFSHCAEVALFGGSSDSLSISEQSTIPAMLTFDDPGGDRLTCLPPEDTREDMLPKLDGLLSVSPL